MSDFLDALISGDSEFSAVKKALLVVQAPCATSAALTAMAAEYVKSRVSLLPMVFYDENWNLEPLSADDIVNLKKLGIEPEEWRRNNEREQN